MKRGDTVIFTLCHTTGQVLPPSIFPTLHCHELRITASPTTTVLTKYTVLHTLSVPQYTFSSKTELLLHPTARVHLNPVHYLNFCVFGRNHQVHVISIDAHLDKLDAWAVLA
jgi:hypothetical protein